MAITDNYVPNKSSGNGVTAAFSGNWNVLSADYFRLYWEDKTTGVQTLKVKGTHYTLAFTASGYTATHDPAFLPPATVWVVRAREITKDQSVPYKTSTGFQGAVIENSLDKLTAMDQEVQDQLDRAVKFPLGTAYSDPFYGDAPADGFGIVWDGVDGRFRNTTTSLADLETQAALLASIAADIVAVAAIDAEVVIVAGIQANVTTVAGIHAAVSTVASISAAVSTVSGIQANVTTVAGISGNVTTVAGISASVSTVAGISANVTTVAGVSANVTTVATNIANVNTVAGISANVTTVAGISANVTTVAGDRTSIIAVAADLTKIDGVYADLVKIDGVYGDLTKIDGVYADLTKIDAVYADLANIDAVYAALTNINTVAGISAAVSTVSTNIAAVNTCSTNIAAIIDAPNQAAAAAASAAAAAAAAAGISMKSSCRVATTGALTVTYANGTLGVGATLTNAGAQAALSLDGKALLITERVLVKDQASALQNGIYVVTVVGTGATNWVLTRATDYDTSSEIVEGTATIISEGTVNASHIFVMTHNGAITVGTTAIDWTALTANATTANTLTTPRNIGGVAFDGSAAIVPQTIESANEATDTTCFPLFITASGTQQLQPKNNTGLTYNSNTNAFNATSLGGTLTTASQPNITGVGTIATGVWNGTAVDVAHGGTGLTTMTTAYAVLCAGTTATGVVQPLAALGASGTVLMSNGAGALPSFQAIPSANGGATTSSNSSSIALTSSSNRMQMVGFTVRGCFLGLPDATTLTTGGTQFMVKNVGTFTFAIRDSLGNIKAVLNPSDSVLLWCSNISTAAGVWAMGDFDATSNTMNNVDVTGATVLSGAGAGGSTYMCITQLDTGTCVIFFWDSTATAAWKAVVATHNGGQGQDITFGSIVTVEAQASGIGASIVRISSTKVLVSYAGTTNTKVMVLSISGTTITTNTALVIEAALSHNHYLFDQTGGNFYFAYSKNTGTKSSGVQVNVSTVTCTMPGAITYGAATIVATDGFMSVCALSTTAYLYCYVGTSSFLCLQVFTTSGSTVTANAAVTSVDATGTASQVRTVAISATVAICTTMNSSRGLNMYTVGISGTVPSLTKAFKGNIYSNFSGSVGSTFSNLSILYVASGYGLIMFCDADAAGNYVLKSMPFKIDAEGNTETGQVRNIGAYTLGTASFGYPNAARIDPTYDGRYGLVYGDYSTSKPDLKFMNVAV